MTTVQNAPDRSPVADVVTAVPARADDLSVALGELSGLLLDSDSLEGTLQRVVDLAVRTMPGCTGASVTLIDGERPVTAAHTDDVALAVDAAQYDVGDGPCLDAARHLHRNSVDLRAAEQAFPEFAVRARRYGICSFLASPLVAGGRGIGSLNLYSTSQDGFDALDEALVGMFTGQASVALANAQLYRAAQQLSEQLTEALASRAVIEQAKGALMVTRSVDEEAAFGLLRERSQRTNRKLRDVAADVLREGSGRTR